MSEPNTKKENVQKYWNWKIVCIFFSVLTLLALLFLVSLRDYFNTMANLELLDKYYTLFVFIIFLNMALATYTISLYYYRISKPGIKGAKGRPGELGDKGDGSQCNIQTPRKHRFKLQKIPTVEKYNIDTDQIQNATLDFDRRNIKPKWFNILPKNDPKGTTNYKPPEKNVIGNKYSGCLTNKKLENKCKLNNGTDNQGIGVIEEVYNKHTDKTNVKYSTKPFNGAILNLDHNKQKTTGHINSLQFTYDKNQPMRKNKVNLALAGSRLGNQTNKGSSGEFTCPPHSSIYKIETLHDMDTHNNSGKIVGMKFHCRDIRTGNHVKILNADNNYVDSIEYGVSPTPKNKYYKYSKVECGNYQRCDKNNPNRCNARPGFLSNYTAIDDSEGVLALKFNRCSYLEPNPIKDYVS